MGRYYLLPMLLILMTSMGLAQTGSGCSISGPTVVSGTAVNYALNCSLSGTISWQATNGSTGGNNTTATVWWYPQQNPVTGILSASVNGTVVASLTVTIYPSASVLVSGQLAAPLDTVLYNTSPGTIVLGEPSGGIGGIYTYKWKKMASGDFFSQEIPGVTGRSYSPGNLTRSTAYWVTTYSGTDSVISNYCAIMVFPFLPGSISPEYKAIDVNSSPGVLTIEAPAGNSGNLSYQWQSSADNSSWADIAGANGQSYNPGNLNSSIFYRVTVTDGIYTLFSRSSKVVVATPLASGVVGPASQSISYNSRPAPLGTTNPSGGDGRYLFQWQSSADGTTWTNVPGAETSGYEPGNLVENIYYRLSVKSYNQQVFSNTVSINVGAPTSQNIIAAQNYIRAWNLTAPVGDPNAVDGSPLSVAKQTTQYYDGLGRLVQTVTKQGATTSSGNSRDFVTMNAYDDYGREIYSYMPIATPDNDGSYKLGGIQRLTSFYGGSQSPLAGQGENTFYGMTEFEMSPLDRVLKMTGPGDSWVGNDRGVQTKYWGNLSIDDVKKWQILENLPGSGSGGAPILTSSYQITGSYPAGTLYKNVTIDEHGRQTIEFKDKENKLILQKIQLESGAADGGAGSGHSGWLCTYYIYDQLQNLRCVIQPEGVKILSSNGWQLTGTLLSEQCFRYEYDDQNRIILNKVPGASEQVLVYDVRGRVVLSQDGNMRNQGSWKYIQYDDLNRQIRTGMVNLSDNNPNTHWAAATSKTGNVNTDIQYPTNSMLNSATILTEIYYDNYGWIASASASGLDSSYDGYALGYLEQGSNVQFPYYQPNQKSNFNKGLVTGTKVNILGSPNYTYAVTIYDEESRPIQVKKKNHTGGIDMTTTQYSWSGQPLIIVNRDQKAGSSGLTVTTRTKNIYNSLWQLTAMAKNVSSSDGLNSGEKIIAVNKYNELGQLVKKTLGATDMSGISGVESQNFEYNVRGWLLGINRNYSSGNSSNNYFGFELNYDKDPVLGGAVGNRYYNGNIAGITWRGKAGGAGIRRYDFSYDKANRIMNADFKEYNGSNFTSTGTFNSRMGDGNPLNPESAYDYNGNIKSMTQQGLYSGSVITIDQLTYSYQPGSNKLAKVTDNAGNTKPYSLGDFNDGANNGDDYTYDVNGNIIMDENKNISSIQYNILNLPEQVNVNGKGMIIYQYDAAGNKLSKTLNETGQSQKITTYLDGMIFENDILQHISMEEGRFRPNGGVLTADYFLKDHLGNVRTTINESGTLLEETNYYPFGLSMSGISYQNTAVPENKKKFNGIEQTKELGLNQYDAFFRTMDPQLGRWWQIDPKPNFMESPYAAMGNNPIMNMDFWGDTARGVTKADAKKLIREIRRSLGGKEAREVKKLFKRDGNSLAQINKEKFTAATSKLKNQDQKNLAIGYMKLVNSDKLHMVDYIKKGDILPDMALKAYKNPLMTWQTVAGAGGGALTRNTEYGSYTTIIDDPKILGSNTYFIKGMGTSIDVKMPTSVGQVTAHELLGHGLGYIYGNHNTSSIQVDNIFLRSKGVNEYYRDKTFHDIEPRVSESEANDVPAYLRDID